MMKQLQEEEPSYYRSSDGVWKRTGGCSTECGACCQYMILPLHAAMLSQPPERLSDWIKWAEYHGIEILVDRGAGSISAKVSLKCEKLADDLTCSVYGTDERPIMCNKYPLHPLDLEGELAEICTYEFSKITST